MEALETINGKSTVHNTAVLIPDGEQYGFAMRVINGLSQIPGIRIYLMSGKKIIPMRYSKYVHKYLYHTEANDTKSWISTILRAVESYNIDIIFPVFETGIKQLLEHKDNFKGKCHIVLLPDLKNLLVTLNKRKFAIHLEKHKIPQPKYFFPEKYQNEGGLKLKLPLITKDLNGNGSGEGVKLFHEYESFRDYLNHADRLDNIIVQEYLKGYDIDCSVLCKDGEIMDYTIQKGLDYGKNKFAPAYKLKFLEDSGVLGVVKPLIKSLNWNGIAHIDMRYDLEENCVKVIEMNPRYWSTADASQLAGVNFPLCHLELSITGKLSPRKYKQIEVWTLKGLLKSLRRNPATLLRTRFLCNNTPLLYLLKDPLPWFFKSLVRLNILP